MALKKLDNGIEKREIRRKRDRLVLSLKGQKGAGLVELLRQELGAYRVRPEDVHPADVLFSLLEERGETVAVAESCTGGLLSKLLTDRSGSSKVFLGGAVVYSNSAKTKLLGADPESLDKFGAVSQAVVRSISAGALRIFGSDYGIGISGVAGPTGGTAEKPVGTVWIGVCGKQGEARQMKFHFTGNRRRIRKKAALSALILLERFILDPDKLDIVSLW
jgi:PncC family amidohydrolase